jgi:hypothetical protein
MNFLLVWPIVTGIPEKNQKPKNCSLRLRKQIPTMPKILPELHILLFELKTMRKPLIT